MLGTAALVFWFGVLIFFFVGFVVVCLIFGGFVCVSLCVCVVAFGFVLVFSVPVSSEMLKVPTLCISQGNA